MQDCYCETKYVVVCAYTKEMKCRCQVNGTCDCIMCSAYPAEQEDEMDLKIKFSEEVTKSITKLVRNFAAKVNETERRFGRKTKTNFVNIQEETLAPLIKMNDQFKYRLRTIRRNSKFR